MYDWQCKRFLARSLNLNNKMRIDFHFVMVTRCPRWFGLSCSKKVLLFVLKWCTVLRLFEWHFLPPSWYLVFWILWWSCDAWISQSVGRLFYCGRGIQGQFGSASWNYFNSSTMRRLLGWHVLSAAVDEKMSTNFAWILKDCLKPKYDQEVIISTAFEYSHVLFLFEFCWLCR